MTQRRHHRATSAAWFAGSTLIVAGAAAVAGVGAAAAPQPAATGHAQVVAQGAVTFSADPHRWVVGDESIAPGSAPVANDAEVPTFVVVRDGSVITSDDAGQPTARLGAGEAAYLAGEPTSLLAGDGVDANFHRIAVEIGSGGGNGQAFAPGAGVRDVELLRDVLEPGETMAIADSDAAPALVVVSQGTVTVAGDPAGSADLTAGGSGTFDGNLTLVNSGTEPAVVVAAVVGPVVQTDVVAPPSSTPETTTDDAPDQPNTPAPPGPSQTTTAPGPSQTTPPGPSQPTTTTQTSDGDGDGLTDNYEDAIGTQVDNPDSDGDGLSDGDEVNTYRTNPLTSRTDSDHLDDGYEIEIGTDPLDPDTDHDGNFDHNDDDPLVHDGDSDDDGLNDDQEPTYGTDPNNRDTDDDGLDDGIEVENGTDPLVPNP